MVNVKGNLPQKNGRNTFGLVNEYDVDPDTYVVYPIIPLGLHVLFVRNKGFKGMFESHP